MKYTKDMKHLLAELRRIGTPTVYRKGERLFMQGEVPTYATAIIGGAVRAYTITAEGEESIVYLYGKGSIIPLAWLAGQAPGALFHYEAISDTRVIKVPKDTFIDIVYNNIDLLKDFLHLVSQSQASLLLRVTGLTQPRAVEKICYALYFLMFRYGLERKDNTYKIDLKLTQGMLAQLIGQSRESTAKNLKILEQAGVVSYKGSTYTINKHRLEQFLSEDSFQKLNVTAEN